MKKKTIKRRIETFPNDKNLNFHDYDNEDEYRYFRFKLADDETINRIDKYSVVKYSKKTGEGYTIRPQKMYFYPSKFGMEEIIASTKNKRRLTANERFMINRLFQLIKYGNAEWRINVKEEVERPKIKINTIRRRTPSKIPQKKTIRRRKQ